MTVEDRVHGFLQELAIIDTHEHIIPEGERRRTDLDLFHFFSHYAGSDLVSAGMTWAQYASLFEAELEFDEKFELFMNYWPLIQNTGYGQAVSTVFREIFGVEYLDQSSVEQLSAAISKSNKPGWYHYILKERSNIEKAILDIGTAEVDAEFFAAALRFDDFIFIQSREDLLELEKTHELPFGNLKQICSALEKSFEQAVQQGIVAVKCGLAYNRNLYFSKPSLFEAEKALERMLAKPACDLTAWDLLPLQDYIFHQVVRCALEYDLPLQIHTGFQEPTATRSGNRVANTDPLQLTNLFLEYEDLRFVLFHGGYPYIHNWAVLGKNFRNVFLDLCWLYIISPRLAKGLLHTALELVSVNKIFGFGGDYLFVEGAFAHARLARKIVGEVLTEKIISGNVREEDALQMGAAILRNNAREFYGL